MPDTKNQPSPVHIGQRVQEVFEQRGLKISAFADALGTVRQNVYRIFKKRHLDTGLLVKISQVLAHNFFQYYCQAGEPDTLADLQMNKLKEDLTLARKEINYLKKIIFLMEERAELVQQMGQTESKKEYSV